MSFTTQKQRVGSIALMVPSSYPVQGMYYMLRHPSLFSHIICPIFWTIIWGIAVLIFGFAYLLKLQAHALIAVKCPAAVAWIVCVIFVLLEVGVLSILFYLIILPIYQDGLFDRVLKLRGLRHVLKQNEGDDMAKCMRGVTGGLWILFMQILAIILTLPLNFVPILGQFVFVTINGWILTFGLRYHYDVEIRNITFSQSKSEAWRRRKEFTAFGAVAFGLEMIPLANILFVWTNIIGSALWVADEIERDQLLMNQESSTQSLMVGQVQMHHIPLSDSPPEYSPGNHIQKEQQQHYYAPNNQNQYYEPQPRTSYHYQESSTHDLFSNQGSTRIPPKNRKHPEV